VTTIEGPEAGQRSQAQLIDSVRQAWAEILDLDSPEQVPLDVRFLEAGGSSLLLIMLWEELHPLSRRTLRVSDLFQHGTVRAQAALLAEQDEAPGVRDFGAGQRQRLLGRAAPTLGSEGAE
jgi:hypothetical protein